MTKCPKCGCAESASASYPLCAACGFKPFPRFSVGDTVYVRDKAAPADGEFYNQDGRFKAPRGGYRIVKAVVREVHSHPGRSPWYPYGEGYSLIGDLWWDCYPGCRVWATREEAIAARLGRAWIEKHFYGESHGVL